MKLKNFYSLKDICKYSNILRYFRKSKYRAIQNKFYELWSNDGKPADKVKYYYLKALKEIDKNSIFFKIKKGFIWLIWDFTSIRFLCSKVKPELKKDNKREPSTFLLWTLSIYFATFSIASARYEHRKDVLETRLAIISTQLPIKTARKGAFRRLVEIQNEKTPKRPDIKNPRLTISSFFSNDIDPDILNESKEIIISEKENLSNLDLSGVDLVVDKNIIILEDDDYVEGADLEGTRLSMGNLKGAHLKDAKLQYANLLFANLEGANLEGANLEGANLQSAKLSGAKNLSNQQITSACNWENADFLTNWDEKKQKAKIKELKEDKASEPKEKPNCDKWK